MIGLDIAEALKYNYLACNYDVLAGQPMITKRSVGELK